MSRIKKGKNASTESESRIRFDPKVMETLVPEPITPRNGSWLRCRALFDDSVECTATARIARVWTGGVGTEVFHQPRLTTRKLTCVQPIGVIGVSPSRKPYSAAASCRVFREHGGGKRCSASAGSHGCR